MAVAKARCPEAQEKVFALATESSQLDANELKSFFHWTLAHPDLIAIVQVAETLARAITNLRRFIASEDSLSEKMTISLRCAQWVVGNRGLLAARVKPNIDYRPRTEDDNPLNRRGFTRHAFYSASYSEQRTPRLREDFYLLIGHFYYAHLLAVKDRVPFSAYLKLCDQTKNSDCPPGDEKSLLAGFRRDPVDAGRRVRYLSRRMQESDLYGVQLRQSPSSLAQIPWEEIFSRDLRAIQRFIRSAHGLPHTLQKRKGGGGGGGGPPIIPYREAEAENLYFEVEAGEDGDVGFCLARVADNASESFGPGTTSKNREDSPHDVHPEEELPGRPEIRVNATVEGDRAFASREEVEAQRACIFAQSLALPWSRERVSPTEAVALLSYIEGKVARHLNEQSPSSWHWQVAVLSLLGLLLSFWYGEKLLAITSVQVDQDVGREVYCPTLETPSASDPQDWWVFPPLGPPALPVYDPDEKFRRNAASLRLPDQGNLAPLVRRYCELTGADHPVIDIDAKFRKGLVASARKYLREVPMTGGRLTISQIECALFRDVEATTRRADLAAVIARHQPFYLGAERYYAALSLEEILDAFNSRSARLRAAQACPRGRWYF